uniref:ARID domain-containing protein n=1 Tax=Esox lucius TaxID=8010 RepID=A0A3P8XEW1_ESOLU
AKYRGAFCEAKIKTVKRMVKVKVRTLHNNDQCISCCHFPGVLLAEGICSEATINKLTDASWYTVVFDDGDEKTLRRTSLCLKGERHFAESETLDQLPLTNPEHFGTPVIGKKGNRGGRRSSQDESEDRRRLNDDLLGKVASIQPGSDRTCWYLALVISPSCNDDLTVKKDQCLVRSFGDSKFHTVARKDVHEVNIDVLSKPEYSSRKGLDGAVHFLKTKVVPDSWKMDMSEILESSSSDDEEMEGKESEEEEEEEEEDEEKEDPEDESDPEERDHFLQQLYKFMEDRGTPINKPPVLGYKDLNLFKLFRLVYHQGGCDNIESGSVWKQIYMDLGIPVLNSAASYNVKTAYRKYLYGFEEYCRSASIVFRTIHHNEACPAPPAQTEQKATHLPEAKDEEEEEGQGSAATIKTEPATATEDEPALEEPGSESDSDKEGRKDLSCHRGRRRCTVTPVKAEVKEPAKLEKIKEEKEEQSGVGLGEPGGEETGGQRDCIRPDGGDNPGKRRSRRLEESDKESEGDGDDDDEDDEEDEEDRERRGEEDDSEDSVTGTKVKVKYGRGKTQKIYEANIKKAENDDAGDVLYLVHYYGWNVRYDEWVKADRIIWPVDKGGTKKNQKKKVKNKEDGEREEDKQGKLGGVKRGRPHLRTTPPNTNRSVSKTPSSEGRSSSKSKSEASALPNGEEKKLPEIIELKEERKNEEELDEERTLVPPMSPEPDRPKAEDLPTSKSPRSKAARRSNAREPERNNNTDSETPTATPNYTETESSPCPHPLKRQDEPMVILRCLPAEHLLNSDFPSMDSDTDSATEEICREDRAVTKRKATEQKTSDKKLRLDKREDTTYMASPARRPIDSPGRRITDSPERLTPAEVKTEMPALTPEVQCRSPEEDGVSCRTQSEQLCVGAEEELIPQIGPEALVCHEVDLDDLDEKDKTSAEDLLMMMSQGKVHAPPPSTANSHHSQTHIHPPVSEGTAPLFSPTSAPSPEESHSTKSESDVTIEVDSVAGESQEGLGDNESANSNCFEASTSSSNSSMSLPERDTKDRGQKRLMDCNMTSSAKKQKRNQKRPSTTSKMDKNGAGHSSDSEDLAVMDSSNKLTPVKQSMSKGSQKLSRSPGVVSPHSKELEKDKHKDKQSSFPSPRTYKWTLQLNELDNMTSAERISFLQDKLKDIKKYYMTLKSEVASIDRRRKRLKKKEREVSHTTASTSSGSSDTGMSPSSASPTQNTVAVECR